MSDTLIRRLGIEAPEEYVGRLVLFEVVPWGRRDLGFSVAVPREYEAATQIALEPALKPGEWQRLCSFESVTAPRETLDVAVCRPFAVNLADLAVYDIKRLGLEPYAIGKLDIGDRTTVECETRTREGGKAWSARSLYYPNGGRVFRVTLAVEAHNAPTREVDWDAIMQTFRCLGASPEPFLEPVETFRGRGGAELSFVHPQRWTLAEGEPHTAARRVALTLKQQEAVRCRLLVSARPREPAAIGPEELIATALEDLAEREGLALDDQPVDSEPLQAPPPVFEPHAVYAQYDGRGQDGEPVEVRMVALASRQTGYTLAAILPVEERDPFGWMYGKHALELACMTLNRPAEIVPYNLELEAGPSMPTAGPEKDEEERRDLGELLAATQKAAGEKAAAAFREAAAKPAPVRKDAAALAAGGVASKKALEEREAAARAAEPGRPVSGEAAQRLAKQPGERERAPAKKSAASAAAAAPAAKTLADDELQARALEDARARRDAAKAKKR